MSLLSQISQELGLDASQQQQELCLLHYSPLGKRDGLHAFRCQILVGTYQV